MVTSSALGGSVDPCPPSPLPVTSAPRSAPLPHLRPVPAACPRRLFPSGWASRTPAPVPALSDDPMTPDRTSSPQFEIHCGTGGPSDPDSRPATCVLPGSVPLSIKEAQSNGYFMAWFSHRDLVCFRARPVGSEPSARCVGSARWRPASTCWSRCSGANRPQHVVRSAIYCQLMCRTAARGWSEAC